MCVCVPFHMYGMHVCFFVVVCACGPIPLDIYIYIYGRQVGPITMA